MNRRLWAGLAPNGIGQQKPHHYGEMAKVGWANRRNLSYAWKVLSEGVCDGCALGVAGFHDWTIDGVHLCMTRLKLLEADPSASEVHLSVRFDRPCLRDLFTFDEQCDGALLCV